MFWLMLFGSTALIMLVAIEPKFAKRQERLERMSQSRAIAAKNISPKNIAAKNAAQRASDVPLSSDAETPRWQADHRPTLRPLILVIAAVVLTGSLAMRFVVARRKQQTNDAPVSRSSPSGEAAS